MDSFMVGLTSVIFSLLFLILISLPFIKAISELKSTSGMEPKKKFFGCKKFIDITEYGNGVVGESGFPNLVSCCGKVLFSKDEVTVIDVRRTPKILKLKNNKKIAHMYKRGSDIAILLQGFDSSLFFVVSQSTKSECDIFEQTITALEDISNFTVLSIGLEAMKTQLRQIKVV